MCLMTEELAPQTSLCDERSSPWHSVNARLCMRNTLCLQSWCWVLPAGCMKINPSCSSCRGKRRLAPHAFLSRRSPIFLTLCHMLVCSTLSYCAAATRVVVLQKLSSKRQLAKIVLLAVIFLLTSGCRPEGSSLHGPLQRLHLPLSLAVFTFCVLFAAAQMQLCWATLACFTYQVGTGYVVHSSLSIPFMWSLVRWLDVAIAFPVAAPLVEGQQVFHLAISSTILCFCCCLACGITRRLPVATSPAVSFDQAIGSTTPAFTALLAFLLFRETETARTNLSLIPVVSAPSTFSTVLVANEIVPATLPVSSTTQRTQIICVVKMSMLETLARKLQFACPVECARHHRQWAPWLPLNQCCNAAVKLICSCLSPAAGNWHHHRL